MNLFIALLICMQICIQKEIYEEQIQFETTWNLIHKI